METILNNFDIGFIISVVLLTYSIIKLIDYLNKEKKVSRVTKRIVLVCAVIVVGSIYLALGFPNKIVLVNSAIASPVIWSWLLKPICAKLGIDYKNLNEILS